MRHATRGTTLVEIVVALVIISIGLLGIIATLTLATRTLSAGRMMTIDAALAASRLDSLRLSQGNSLSCGSLTSGSQVRGSLGERWTVSGAGATRALTVALTAPAGIRVPVESVSTITGCR